MGAVATREAAPRAPASGSAGPPAQRLFEPQGPTLEDAILATWEELVSRDIGTCPVCSGEMSRAGGCKHCSSRLD